MNDTIIRVSHPSRDNVRIVSAPGYEISIMVGSRVDAFVAALDGTETLRVELEGPSMGQKVEVLRVSETVVDVFYRNIGIGK